MFRRDLVKRVHASATAHNQPVDVKGKTTKESLSNSEKNEKLTS